MGKHKWANDLHRLFFLLLIKPKFFTEQCSPKILIYVVSKKKKSPWLIVIIQTTDECSL